MLSGYLVISKKRTVKENIDKTFKKILLPLSFFTLVNIAYNWTKFSYNGSNFSVFIFQELERLTRFPSSSLWFLQVLFFLYLLNPIWQIIFEKKGESEIARFITFSSLFFSLLVTIIAYPAGKSGLLFTTFTAWTSFTFFYLYGGLVRNKWIQFRNQKINFGLIGFGFILTILGDYLTMWQKVNLVDFPWNDYTGNYLSIPVTMMAIGIFNFLISVDLSKYKTNFIIWLSGLSFGIYLIHTYVISLFTDILGFDFNKVGINVYIYNIVNVILVFSISLVITYIWRKIPKLKVLIGG